MKEIKIPELAESITEGTIAEWLVKKGDKVEKGDPVVELETDKVNVEVNSDYSGVIAEVLAEEGDDVSVGDTIAKVDENGEAGGSTDSGSSSEAPKEEPKKEEAPKAQEQQASSESKESSSSDEQIVASPAARKLARELNIDLSKVKPQDPLGRIRPEDVEAANQTASAPSPAPKASSDAAAKEDGITKPVKVEKMSRRRQTIAKRLVEAQHNAAMLTTFNEVDMTAVMNLRKERQEKFVAKNDIKLGFMSFFTKASVAALKEFPLLNAEIDGTNLIQKQYYDIGIAVSTDDGLVVPVVRDADKLDFGGIEKEIKELGLKARDKKLKMEELQGGSFTITNGGIFGSMLSTPILNAPQVGILGMHNIVKRAVVMPDDTIEVRPMMYLALSYDHRIVDGKEAVQFLVRVKEMLEDPYDLLLQG